MKAQSFSTEWGGHTLTLETGKLAQKANAAVWCRYGDTVVLATVVMGGVRAGIDYFPLMVDVEEKLYAAGKIKGSRFIKKEGRASDAAVLSARLIDRSIRPLFDERIKNDVQVVVTVLSVDQENDSDVPGFLAAVAALAISDIPWDGPIGGLRVGLIPSSDEGKKPEWVINPTFAARLKGTLELFVAGKNDSVIMVEAAGSEVPEEVVAEGIAFAQKHQKLPIELIEEMVAKVGKAKNTTVIVVPTEEEKTHEDMLRAKVNTYLAGELKGYWSMTSVARTAHLAKVTEALDATLKADNEVSKDDREVALGFIETYIDADARRLVLDEDRRVDGRGLDEIRELEVDVALLPRTHGSALFRRGETQVLSVTTLGSPGMEQIVEGIEEEFKKRYMHHYYFPGFSVGEAKPNRGPGRREIGHGALAEKALEPVLPSKEEFPYTIRVVSDVLTSNGSTSQASTCGSSLALMDAGVPIKAAVAGISVGLVTEMDTQGNMKRYKLLTDIQGVEDFNGDMDFKVAGTRTGVTAIQFDTKLHGIHGAMISEILTRARAARMKILDAMDVAIATPRAELSPYAPRVYSLRIDPLKIGLVIGPGGKTINEITTETGVEIDIEEDGLVFVTSQSAEGADRAMQRIRDITRELKEGEVFEGKVRQILDFGVVVEVLPKQEGLVHVSEMAHQRIGHPADLVKVGDAVKVKVIHMGIDGKIALSMRQADSPNPPEWRPPPGRGAPRGDRGGGFRERR